MRLTNNIVLLKIIGLLCAAAAIVLNPSLIGSILLGRAITNGAVLLFIVAVEIALAALGVALFLKPRFFIEKRKEIALLIIVSIFSLGALELIAKAVWQSPLAGWYGYPPGLYEPHEKMGYVFKPNFKGYFPNPPFQNIAIEINSRGLRDNEHEYKKQNGDTRILGLGDSITFGSGVPFEDTYLRNLEKKLSDVEIIKAGVNSYDFDHIYTYYKEEGHKYNPDIVLYGLFLNDIHEVTPAFIEKQKQETETLQQKEARGIYTENPTLLDRIKTICTLCDIAHTALYAATNKNTREYYNLAYFNSVMNKKWTEQWPAFEKKIVHFNNELMRDGKKLFIVIFPQTEQFSHSYGLTRFPQEQLKKMGMAYDIEVLDLLPHFDVPKFEMLYLGGDSIHPNPAGHALASEIIFSELKERDILKQ